MQNKVHQSAALTLMLSLVYLSPNAQASGSTESAASDIERINVQGKPIKRNSGPTGLDLTIQETPQSVSVIDKAFIEDFKLEDIEDVLVQATGISRYKFGAGDRTEFTSRGYLINALVKDGLPASIAAPRQNTLDTIVYDRVEVLRGAAGLMAGAGQPSATLNVITKAADREGFVELGAEVGSFNRYRTHVDATGALTSDEALAGRVIIAYEDQDSFVDRENSNKIVAYTQLNHRFSEDTEATFSIHYQESELNLAGWGVPIFFNDGTEVDVSDETNLTSPHAYNDNIYQSYHFKLTHQINLDWQLNVGAQYSKTEEDLNMTYFFGNPDKATGLGVIGLDRRQHTIVDGTNFIVGLVGRVDLFDREHQINVTYLNADFDSDDDRYEELDADKRNVMYQFGSIYEANPGGAILNADKPHVGYWVKSTKEQSLAVSGKIELTDELHAVVGLKYFDYDRSEERDFEWSGFSSHQGDETGESLYYGLVYDINEDISTYASYTDAYEPQLDKYDVNGNQLDPITARNLEFGVKASLVDDKVRVHFAYFDSLKEDYGVALPREPNQRTVQYRAVDGSEVDGFELEVDAKITEQWNVSLGYTNYDAVDENGDDINPYAPRESLNLSTKYKHEAWTFGANVTWDEDSYVDILGVRGFDHGLPKGTARGLKAPYEGQTIFNAHAQYEYSEALTFKLSIRNATDERFYDTYGFVPKRYNDPRAYNLSVKYRF